MPEGDTIHRAARTLQTALAGRAVKRFETVFPALARVDADQPLAGRTIERVYASGKNLMIEFSGGLHLRTHMRMHGSWHLYRPGERWQKPRDHMRIVVETDEWVAVGFSVPVAEFHDARSLERQEDLRRIGPDLLAEDFDSAEAKRRIRERAGGEIAEVLLNQRVVAGIGNEYKSEVLFVSGVHPFKHVEELSDTQLDTILRYARKLMRANVERRLMGRRTTGSMDPAKRLFVYARAGEPCRRCGTAIESARQGPHARGTWWCPRCQAR